MTIKVFILVFQKYRNKRESDMLCIIHSRDMLCIIHSRDMLFLLKWNWSWFGVDIISPIC